MMHVRRYVPLVATLAVIAVNAAANILPINGMNTGQLSALYPTGFTPSGWAFSIWSLIYLGLLAFSLISIIGTERARARVQRLLPWYLVNAAGNAGWIIAWHYHFVALSVAIMLVILLTLVVMTAMLRNAARPTRAEFWAIDAPMRLYFGWITAATLVNIATLFYDWQDYPFGTNMAQWALVSVIAATAIYIWMAASTRDWVYCGVGIWVAVAIAVRPIEISAPVRTAAGAATALVAIALVVALVDSWRRRTPLST
jgi:translocator protein